MGGRTPAPGPLGNVLDLKFSRIQFTPDLMPADIVGTEILSEENGHRFFRFQPGPIFANLVLADEINRGTPKTQSALLEAMQEFSVTVAQETHMLQKPFFVLATQNPLEMEGTYPLPEAQLDRFFFKIFVSYPTNSDLVEILTRTTSEAEQKVNVVINGDQLLEMRTIVRAVPLASHIGQYVADLITATHPSDESKSTLVNRFVRYGASPRGGQAIILAAKVNALLEGRYNVAFEDVNKVAVPALRHRLILNFEGLAEGISNDEVIFDLLGVVLK